MSKIEDMICERVDKTRKLNCILKINAVTHICELYSSKATGPGWWKVKKCRKW